VFPILVPPLRQRIDDVTILAEAFIRTFCAKAGRPVIQIGPDSVRRFRAYEWPGNVRELQNVIERAVILSKGAVLDLSGILPQAAKRAASVTVDLPEIAGPRTDSQLREFERANILQALQQAGWKISGPSGAAQILGLAPSTLASRMKALGIQRRK
jgi:transcriptional regulator with GAF, ATPase, and Fis domain